MKEGRKLKKEEGRRWRECGRDKEEEREGERKERGRKNGKMKQQRKK